MTIEFIGIAATAPHSETEIAPDYADPERTGPVQPRYLEELARAHEEAGFDRVLIAHSSASPDGFTVADQVLARTQRLGVLLAHRPGFVAPTYAARKFATLDAFHPGRVALHVITGGDDADQARDGDLADKVTRYRRTDEFLDVLRLEWTSANPFDYAGEFYHVKGGLSGVRPPLGRIPVYFGGASADAIRVGGKHADVYAFWGEPLAGIQERIDQVRAAAAPVRAGPPVQREPAARSRPRPRRRRGSGPRTSWNSPRNGPAAHASSSTSITPSSTARSGCWNSRPRVTCTTSGCGPLSRR